MLGIIQDVKSEDLLEQNAEKIEFYKEGEDSFNSYIKRRKLLNLKKSIIAVLNDRSMGDKDLIFTTSGIFIWSRTLKAVNFMGVFTCFIKGAYSSLYKDIKRDDSYERKIDIGGYHYNDERVNLDKLYDLITKLKEVANKNNNETKNIADEIKPIMFNAYNREEEKKS